tara:strand:+ start:339 stop:671 length:333 start_codon:yes stop_codon:yes gene_type:complete
MPKPSLSLTKDFLKKYVKNAEHNQTNKKVSSKFNLKKGKTEIGFERTRVKGGHSTISASLKRDIGKGVKAYLNSDNGVKSAGLQVTKRFKDGGLIETEQKRVRRKYGKGE